MRARLNISQQCVLSIEPDRVQLNTVSGLGRAVLPSYESEMINILGIFKDAEIIPDWTECAEMAERQSPGDHGRPRAP